MPHDDDELRDWLWECLRVRLPERACCPEHRAPFQAFADAYFARSPISVWVASRGFGGKSMMLATLALTEATALGAEVRVLGGSADQSENVVRYTDGMVDLPTFPTGVLAGEGLLGPRRQRSGVTKTRVRLANGGTMLAVAASTRAVRGPHPSRLRIDEADELALAIFNASLGQTMAKHGVPAQTVISSTWHYPDGTMTEVLGRARDNDWPVYRWCHQCTARTADNPTGWLDPAEIERKRREVPPGMFAVEYDLGEPTSEGGAIFQATHFDRRYDPTVLPVFGLVVLTVDSAFSTSVAADWSVIATWAATATHMYLLDEWRGKVEYPDLLLAISDQYAKWLGRGYSPWVYIENKASGQSAIQTLRRESMIPVRKYEPGAASKQSRAQDTLPFFVAGRVKLPTGQPWLAEWIAEHLAFRGGGKVGAHDDRVDTTSMAVRILSRVLTGVDRGQGSDDGEVTT